MSNFDLDSIWEEEQPKAAAYYTRVATKLDNLVRQGSKHVLQKLRRTIVLEWLTGIVLLAVLLFYYRAAPYFGWMLVFTGLTLAMAIYPYWQLWRKITTIPTQSLKKSLTAYLGVVRLFIKRIEWFCIIGAPLGGILGMYLAIQEEGGTIGTNHWLFMIGVSLLIGLVLYIPMKYWYIPALYGRTEKELQQLLAQLEEDGAV